MIWKRAEIGIVLLGGSFPVFLFLFTFSPLGSLLTDLYMSGRLDDYTLSVLTNIPVCVLGVAGLSLYIAGREDFLKSLGRDKIASLVFVFLGVLLILLGIWFSLWNYGVLEYYSEKNPWKPMAGERLLGYLLPFGWCVLWLISGVLWIADGFKSGRKQDRDTNCKPYAKMRAH